MPPLPNGMIMTAPPSDPHQDFMAAYMALHPPTPSPLTNKGGMKKGQIFNTLADAGDTLQGLTGIGVGPDYKNMDVGSMMGGTPRNEGVAGQRGEMPIGDPVALRNLYEGVGLHEGKVSSAFEKLKGAGLQDAVAKEGGFFMDDKGKVLQLPANLTHEGALLKGGLINEETATTRPKGMPEMGFALSKHKLIRIRETPERVGLEMGHNPSDDQLTAIVNRLSANPHKEVLLDLYKPGDILSKMFKSGADALHALLTFY